MKRFYKQVSIAKADSGYEIRLDDRPIRTPAKATLLLPTQSLADAIAAEWNAQTDKIDPQSMPMTGLSNAAIDHIQPDVPRFAANVSVFGESDLLIYRAEGPRSLVERQQALWDPIISWASKRYDIGLVTTVGIIHKPQAQSTLDRLRDTVAGLPPFQLAALNNLVTISGSLLIGLAMIEKAINADEAWNAGHIDELWQVEQWGDDEFAIKARTHRKRDFDSAAHFLSLLEDAA